MPHRYLSSHPAHNLPDSFAKSPRSNNYKILEIERTTAEEIEKKLETLAKTLNTEESKGRVLDDYGQMYGQGRGMATDSQYVYMIRAKVMRNISSGDYGSIVRAICKTFSCSPKYVSIVEEETPCRVKVVVLPLNVINAAGLSVQQTVEMIKQLLPVGIKLESVLFDGSFEFTDKASEEDRDRGFADLEQSYGGFFGLLSGTETVEIALPI